MDLHGFGPHLLTGVWLTIKLGLLSLVVAGLLGILGALAKLSSVPPLRLLAQIYTTLVRGIPDLVLMLIIFYGGQIALNQAGEAWGLGYIDVNPFIAGVLTLRSLPRPRPMVVFSFRLLSMRSKSRSWPGMARKPCPIPPMPDAVKQ